MADLISNQSAMANGTGAKSDEQTAQGSVQGCSRSGASGNDEKPDIVGFIELLFFAYRDFVNDPDEMLEEIGFGRAHHRVLHFVYRHPGIRVSRLLGVLNITKQSLARVLRQLIEERYVEQRAGQNDRRERCLFLTDAGVALFERLVAPQRARVSEALAAIGPDLDHGAVERFLHAMIEEPDRDAIRELITTGTPVGGPSAEAA